MLTELINGESRIGPGSKVWIIPHCMTKAIATFEHPNFLTKETLKAARILPEIEIFWTDRSTPRIEKLGRIWPIVKKNVRHRAEYGRHEYSSPIVRLNPAESLWIAMSGRCLQKLRQTFNGSWWRRKIPRLGVFFVFGWWSIIFHVFVSPVPPC